MREYAILECLALRKGRVVSRETLLECVYDGDEMPGSNVLEVYIGYLRAKLEQLGAHQLSIVTVRGIGYRLAVRRPP